LESYFDTVRYERRVSHVNTASKMMKALAKKYKDVYFLEVPNVLGENGTTDNSHPTDLGFHRFVTTYQPKIAKILKKYGIK
jgi:acetylornithine deacetylase/succinyl-diaminopimelate desuccinylase-like protein